jgi:hypothetical protein
VYQPITLADPVPEIEVVSVTLFSGGALTMISVLYESAPALARRPVTLTRAMTPAAGATLVPAVDTVTVDVPATADDAATERSPLKVMPAGTVMRVPEAVRLPARI